MKRYKALFVHKGCCDGIWDNKKKEYCSWYTIEDVMNQSQGFDNIWVQKYESEKESNRLLKQRINYLENLLRKHNIGGFK